MQSSALSISIYSNSKGSHSRVIIIIIVIIIVLLLLFVCWVISNEKEMHDYEHWF